AVAFLRQAVALAPDQSAYHAHLAYGYVGLGHLPEALAAFERAARHAPDDPALQLGVGNCLGLMGKAAEAEGVLRRLVERYPRFALGWFNLGKALEEQNRYEEACSLYLRATQLEPRSAEGHTNLGLALSKLGRFAEAEQAHRASIACNPAYAASYVNLAIVLNALRRLPEAESMCREALKRDPGLLAARIILGRSLVRQGKWAEGLKCFEEAAASQADNAELLRSLGDVLACHGRIADALEAYESALSLGASAPGGPSVHMAKATALCSAGRMYEGAAAYLDRDERRRFAAQHPERPLAAALPLDMRGERACLLGEQGIGDQVFFLRYAPGLKSRGCGVFFQGTRKIASVLARSQALDQALPRAESLVAADRTLFVGDLPHLAGGVLESSPLRARGGAPGVSRGTAVPAGAFAWHCRVYWPELPPPLPLEPLAERTASVVRQLALLGPPPYVGLTWRAGTGPDQQRGYDWVLFKEIPLAELAGALRGVTATLVSVQRNPLAGETDRLASLVGRPVHDLSAANDDLEEALALMAVLDDYVGVSNTNMHLRASAGRTARVLVPWPAEWRWLVAGDESPWFPGFRIYRQKRAGDWSQALARLRDDLVAAG
ncbi:MAG TPA: tetratricopeptide repeat protein, partial [Burkholderiales bacterium]|nr:tetratricopeptide repeat protein [Burkholderiales bacterium]